MYVDVINAPKRLFIFYVNAPQVVIYSSVNLALFLSHENGNSTQIEMNDYLFAF